MQPRKVDSNLGLRLVRRIGGETNHDYAVAVEIRRNDGVPAARIASIRRVKVDPRL